MTPFEVNIPFLKKESFRLFFQPWNHLFRSPFLETALAIRAPTFMVPKSSFSATIKWDFMLILDRKVGTVGGGGGAVGGGRGGRVFPSLSTTTYHSNFVFNLSPQLTITLPLTRSIALSIVTSNFLFPLLVTLLVHYFFSISDDPHLRVSDLYL